MNGLKLKFLGMDGFGQHRSEKHSDPRSCVFPPS